ncbi:hypothetical protein [Adhaeribacter terreus]|uniref:Uncharacterized protein n=1 Tax=Adhaeribacter terreus TaxID=529703 RepID=A0ABW0E6C8_9BACT
MTRLLCFLFSLILSQICLAQESLLSQDAKYDSIILSSSMPNHAKLRLISKCNEAAKNFAQQDIKNDSAFIYVLGGIAIIEYTTDEAFEKRYNVRFHSYGCNSAQQQCLINYNWLIFDYLETKFGKIWRKEIRKDAVGFKEWKRKN